MYQSVDVPMAAKYSLENSLNGGEKTVEGNRTLGRKIIAFITFKDTNDKEIRWARHAIVLAILVAVNLGVSSAVATTNNSDWLDTLINPPFRPPNWLFAPVWTILYILIAFSAWRVYYKMKFCGQRAAAYIVQLVLNFTWVPVFFKYHEMFGALVVIILMLAAIVWTMVAFKQVDTIAVLVLIPYLLWVTFATCLSIAYWYLNFEQFGFGNGGDHYPSTGGDVLTTAIANTTRITEVAGANITNFTTSP